MMPYPSLLVVLWDLSNQASLFLRTKGFPSLWGFQTWHQDSSRQVGTLVHPTWNFGPCCSFESVLLCVFPFPHTPALSVVHPYSASGLWLKFGDRLMHPRWGGSCLVGVSSEDSLLTSWEVFIWAEAKGDSSLIGEWQWGGLWSHFPARSEAIVLSLQVFRNCYILEFPLWLSGLRTWLVSMRMWVWFLVSLSGLAIWCCCELWCKSQMRLGSPIAVDQQQQLWLDP